MINYDYKNYQKFVYKNMSKIKNTEIKDKTSVLTVRIDDELDQILSRIKNKKGITKAKLIRNYLEMAKYLILDGESIQSLNNRDFIIIKRSFLKRLVEKLEELEQIELGEKFGRLINDIATLQGKTDDNDYKIDLCEHLGFFTKHIDSEGYLLILKKFGPQKFVESFLWKIIKNKDFDTQFIESEIEKSSKVRSQYDKVINPLDRSTSHYAFEFAKMKKK